MVKYQRVLKTLPIPFHVRTEIAVLFSFSVFFLDGEVGEYLEPDKQESAQEQLAEATDILVNVLLVLEKYEGELLAKEQKLILENAAARTALSGVAKSSCAAI